ncbi:TfoX/Sxy family protein [Pseudofrankia inefficax]|uniref:TfoX domain-containing protein n=1 Tax=Pseudofrankia inefficax (strain DSM 45817 / CECT 9037 / DDB 130130 / EuI1c) TaxID=298654 RepID=E3J2X7_PSEI1|nr:TfoX/Sxy family protein [Pseudofrankia inefficax]ADP81788.1 TfoX domain-containing protein [Pseudofrankia inefficax]
MAFDAELAERVRDVLGPRAGLAEKRMFSGLAFLLDGNMVCAVMSRGLMLRVGPDAYPTAIIQDGVSPFEMRGRAMNGWVLVDPAAVAGTDALIDWLDQGVRFAGGLPPGGTAKKKASRRTARGAAS